MRKVALILERKWLHINYQGTDIYTPHSNSEQQVLFKKICQICVGVNQERMDGMQDIRVGWS